MAEGTKGKDVYNFVSHMQTRFERLSQTITTHSYNTMFNLISAVNINR